jgi:hypothetical protein
MLIKIEAMEFKLGVMGCKPSNSAKILPLKLSLDGKILTTMGEPKGNY